MKLFGNILLALTTFIILLFICQTLADIATKVIGKDYYSVWWPIVCGSAIGIYSYIKYFWDDLIK